MKASLEFPNLFLKIYSRKAGHRFSTHVQIKKVYNTHTVAMTMAGCIILH